MNFRIKMPYWANKGIEPSEELKTIGFEGQKRPPANVFNWFFALISDGIEELQNKLHEVNNSVSNLNKSSVGLDKVDNTADSEKAVAFASEAGVGRKVKYTQITRFNGGSTEGVDLFTYDGSTSKSINITADKIGAVKKDLSNVEDEVLKEKVESVVKTGTPVVAATSTDGITYTATVDNVTELYNGIEIIIIPNVKSESKEMTLNVNGLGAIPIRRPLSFTTFVATPIDSDKLYFLAANTPCRLMYHANYTSGGIWLMADKQKTSAQDLYGTVPIESGGTGADTADEALANLGGVSKKGDTMTGAIHIESNGESDTKDYYAISKDRTNVSGNTEHKHTITFGSSSYNGAATIEHKTDGIVDGRLEVGADVLEFMRSFDVAGSQRYKIYGEHFKPTAADVGALPVAGGTLTGSFISLLNGLAKTTAGNGFVQLETYKTAGDTNNRRVLALKQSNDLTACLQIADWVSGSSEYYKVFGEHNKPAGTYTGNGTSKGQTIDIGGTGNFILIQSNYHTGIVGEYGGIVWKYDHSTDPDTTVTTAAYASDHMYFKNGKLWFSGTLGDVHLNDNYTYNFYVL